MPAPGKYPDEMRERARWLVAEARGQDPRLSINVVCKRVVAQLGFKPDTLRNWCRQDDIDAGRAPGTTTADAARIRELERENRELKRANEILKTASAFFAAAELDRRLG